jgi:hypothetical protein
MIFLNTNLVFQFFDNIIILIWSILMMMKNYFFWKAKILFSRINKKYFVLDVMMKNIELLFFNKLNYLINNNNFYINNENNNNEKNDNEKDNNLISNSLLNFKKKYYINNNNFFDEIKEIANNDTKNYLIWEELF